MNAAIDAVAKLEKIFEDGGIVEIIEGNPVRPYALIRLDKDDNKLVPLVFPRMSQGEYDYILQWHSQKWETLLKDKKFRAWAKRHPVPGGE